VSSAAYEMALFLEANAVGSFAGQLPWSISVNREPVEPIKTLSLHDTGGEGLDTDELATTISAVQVRTRANDYLENYAKQEEVRDLIAINNEILDNWLVFMTSDIASLGIDENDRTILISNYRIRRPKG
jgi:hypothetical protein